MSFNGFKDIIKEGDVVVLYLQFNQIHVIEATAKTISKKGTSIDNIYQTPFGALRCAELIGKKFGSRIHLSNGWVHILQPTPEYWTISLPHRTQIIYTPDISMIIMQLELKPNSIVIESGTGSGSLSHALIRAIKPHGHLHTFDFHEGRVKTAADEFERHGLQEFVTVRHRDVCSIGFGDELDNVADAVFLDLPHPWLAIPHALNSLKNKGGRICSFSPCIEQVQKTRLKLSELGFVDVETMEVLQTQYSVQSRNISTLNLSILKNEKNELEDYSKQERESIKTIMAVPPKQQAGHTGFLMFATLPPKWARFLNNTDDNDMEMEENV